MKNAADFKLIRFPVEFLSAIRRSGPRTRVVWIAGVLLALLPGRFLPAQTVRGQLVEETLNAPIEGAFVVLLDQQEEQVAAMLTNAAGRFVLQAPAPGRYRLMAERIGFRSYLSSELELQAGQVLDYRMTMPVRPIRLADISVKGERQCEIRKAEGERVADIWDEARKALTAAVWTEKERNFRFTTQLWDRLLDPRNFEILEQQEEIKTGLAEYPFRALPAEQLAEVGYVRRFQNATEYYAPDAQTLLSEVFLDDHCFSVVEGKGPNSGLLGLVFEPAVEASEKTDVSGVLWLNARDAHLRYVEYRYENLPADIRESEKLGGRLEFRMLPGGAWVVDDWYIRMPVTDASLADSPGSLPGDMQRLREKRKLVAIKEEGGAVIGISDAGGRAVSRMGRGGLSGVVYDSTQNAPLPYATVSLAGTNFRTTTDDRGQYTMPYLPPGNFFVTISHPRIGMLRLGSALRPVQIRADTEAIVNLVIPPARRLGRTLCPSQDADRGILVGLVIDAASGAPLRGATVRVSSQIAGAVRDPASGPGSTAGADPGFEATSDENGGVLVCNVPTGATLYSAAGLEAATGSHGSEVLEFTVAEGEIHEALLEVELPAGGPRRP